MILERIAIPVLLVCGELVMTITPPSLLTVYSLNLVHVKIAEGG